MSRKHSLSLATSNKMTFRIRQKDRQRLVSLDEVANQTFVALGNNIDGLDAHVSNIYEQWDINPSLIKEDNFSKFRVIATSAVITLSPCYQKLEFISP